MPSYTNSHALTWPPLPRRARDGGRSARPAAALCLRYGECYLRLQYLRDGHSETDIAWDFRHHIVRISEDDGRMGGGFGAGLVNDALAFMVALLDARRRREHACEQRPGHCVATAATICRAVPPPALRRRLPSPTPVVLLAPPQAVVVRENGPAENLKYETDFPTPKPADGQVLVKNEYTGTQIPLPAHPPCGCDRLRREPPAARRASS